MVKKKLSKCTKGPVEEMSPQQQVQGIIRKRVLANGFAGRHPCPGESPSRKKKSLSQFASPSPNSKKRMQAAIVAARQNKRPMKKSRGDVHILVPMLEPRVFEHVLAVDVLRAVEEGKAPSARNSPILPSKLPALQEQRSLSQPTTTQRGQYTNEVEIVQGLGCGMQTQIDMTPIQAQKEQIQQGISTDPLIRARRILEFPVATSLSEVASISPKKSKNSSAIPVVPLSHATELSNLDVGNSQAATTTTNGDSVNAKEVLPLSTEGVLPPVLRVLAKEVGGEGIAASPQGVENEVVEFPLDTAPENELNSARYGEHEEFGCGAPATTTGTYSREFVERLLSLLPPNERETFLKTHAIPAPMNPLPSLATRIGVPEFPSAKAVEPLTVVCEGLQVSSPQSQTVLISSRQSIDICKENLVTEEQFQQTLRELARDEKRYKKRQAKKLARQEKKKRRAKLADHPPVNKFSSTPKPPLAPSHLVTNFAGSSTLKLPHGKKDACPSSGGSSDTPSSSVGRTSAAQGDSVDVLRSWDGIQGIPPFEVNSLTAPTGEFWEHMRRYALEQAPFEFPWHLNWNKQCPKLKARFTLKLRKIYPGPWDQKSILRAVGANLRERRTRLKRKFENCRKISQVSLPAGCSKGSWMMIYESTKDTKKQRKAKLCKEAADKRFKVQGPTHRCGQRGIKGLYDRFVDYFNRPPTDEELEYGKMNGWADLKSKVEKALDVEDAPTDLVVKEQVKLTSTSNTSLSDSSTDSSSDGESSTGESESDEE